MLWLDADRASAENQDDFRATTKPRLSWRNTIFEVL